MGEDKEKEVGGKGEDDRRRGKETERGRDGVRRRKTFSIVLRRRFAVSKTDSMSTLPPKTMSAIYRGSGDQVGEGDDVCVIERHKQRHLQRAHGDDVRLL